MCVKSIETIALAIVIAYVIGWAIKGNDFAMGVSIEIFVIWLAERIADYGYKSNKVSLVLPPGGDELLKNNSCNCYSQK